MCTRGLIYYTRNSLIFCPNIIPAASGGASKTVYETVSLAFVLNLGLKSFIIYVYLQRIILGKTCGNDWGLNKYCNE